MRKMAEKFAETTTEVLDSLVILGIIFNSFVGVHQIIETRDGILEGRNLDEVTAIGSSSENKEKAHVILEKYIPSALPSIERFQEAVTMVARYAVDPGIAIGHSASARFIKGYKFTMEDALDSSVLVRSYKAWEEQKKKAAASEKLTKG